MEIVLYIILFIIYWLSCGKIGFEIWKDAKIFQKEKQDNIIEIDIKYLFYKILPYERFFIFSGIFGLIYAVFTYLTKNKEK